MGIAETFESLVEEHKRILYKVSNSYCRNRDDREDLAQEIIVQLWRSFPSFNPHYRFSTWMYRIALNVAISFYRRERTRSHYLAAGEYVLDVPTQPAIQTEDVRLLHEFIDTLDPLHKALVLLYLDGHSHREIADVLGITETNAATKIGRLKQKMKEEFA